MRTDYCPYFVCAHAFPVLGCGSDRKETTDRTNERVLWGSSGEELDARVGNCMCVSGCYLLKLIAVPPNSRGVGTAVGKWQVFKNRK